MNYLNRLYYYFSIDWQNGNHKLIREITDIDFLIHDKMDIQYIGQTTFLMRMIYNNYKLYLKDIEELVNLGTNILYMNENNINALYLLFLSFDNKIEEDLIDEIDIVKYFLQFYDNETILNLEIFDSNKSFHSMCGFLKILKYREEFSHDEWNKIECLLLFYNKLRHDQHLLTTIMNSKIELSFETCKHLIDNQSNNQLVRKKAFMSRFPISHNLSLWVCYAIMHDNIDIIDYIFYKVGQTKFESMIINGLIYCMKTKNFDKMTYLLDKVPNININNTYSVARFVVECPGKTKYSLNEFRTRNTKFLKCIDNVEVYNYLLERNLIESDPFIDDSTTLFLHSLKNNHFELADEILKNGVNLGDSSKSKNTICELILLRYLIDDRKIEYITKLINAGAVASHTEGFWSDISINVKEHLQVYIKNE